MLKLLGVGAIAETPLDIVQFFVGVRATARTPLDIVRFFRCSSYSANTSLYSLFFVQPIVKYLTKSYLMNDRTYFYNLYIILKIYNYVTFHTHT